jgi:uncharacterized membrane protein
VVCTFGVDMQKEYLIEFGDAVVAVKQSNGRAKLNQLFHPTASGAVSGTFWALIGMIFLMPLAGAASGGVLTDNGTNDQVHEGRRANLAVRQRRAVSADP